MKYFSFIEDRIKSTERLFMSTLEKESSTDPGTMGGGPNISYLAVLKRLKWWDPLFLTEGSGGSRVYALLEKNRIIDEQTEEAHILLWWGRRGFFRKLKKQYERGFNKKVRLSIRRDINILNDSIF